jgi:hypothetical protein
MEELALLLDDDATDGEGAQYGLSESRRAERPSQHRLDGREKATFLAPADMEPLISSRR